VTDDRRRLRTSVAGIVTLTTDFGLRDAYVAEMKGVMLGIARAAQESLQLIDVTHDVERHDITEGALAVEAAAPFFPAGTVHLAVVDPGVGTARRGLAIAADGHLLVGPDNGVFSPFLDGDGWRAFELTEPDYRLPIMSRTFHGRDLFAPAAAHLALGVDPARLGPAVRDPVRLAWPEVRAVAGAVAGAVVHTDRFGNLITSIHARSVQPLDADVVIRVGGRDVPLVGTYADLPPGRAGALVGSGGRLEIAVREGSAAAALRARRGTPVVVSRPASRRARRRR
jgi:S-adenosylmethionine hydrolase